MTEETKPPTDAAAGDPEGQLLSLDEAVQFLGTSAATIYRQLRQGDLKGLKMGRQWRFRKRDLTAYLERSPIALAGASSADLQTELAFFGGAVAEEDAGDAEAMARRLAERILTYAIEHRASDIHIEPGVFDGQSCCWLRIRVDGVLQDVRRMAVALHEAIVACFKTMADMNVDEKRLPQDGRVPVLHQGKDYEVRINTCPTVYPGESMVMRILNRSTVLIGLDRLGLALGGAVEEMEQLRGMIHQPNGIILFSGPNGSGKSTTIYSCLLDIAAVEKKVVTVEDPVEVALPYVTQIGVNTRIGLTFLATLRSIMRQDPDVVYVSELRDLDTAREAVKTALTGHLVLAALPTSDAASTVQRLTNMGIEPYLISAMALGVVSQRLCRRVCEGCREPASPGELGSALTYLRELAAEGGYTVPKDAQFVRGRGCEQCRNRGYRGRIGIFELMVKTPAVAEAILRGASEEELTAVAVGEGMKTLIADGVRKAVEGHTTLDEVMRVTFSA
jgi:general secretion pathway protein E